MKSIPEARTSTLKIAETMAEIRSHQKVGFAWHFLTTSCLVGWPFSGAKFRRRSQQLTCRDCNLIEHHFVWRILCNSEFKLMTMTVFPTQVLSMMGCIRDLRKIAPVIRSSTCCYVRRSTHIVDVLWTAQIESPGYNLLQVLTASNLKKWLNTKISGESGKSNLSFLTPCSYATFRSWYSDSYRIMDKYRENVVSIKSSNWFSTFLTNTYPWPKLCHVSARSVKSNESTLWFTWLIRYQVQYRYR